MKCLVEGCGQELIRSSRRYLVCPTGHGKLVYQPDVRTMDREQRKAWIESLPVAKRVGSCSVGGRRLSVWRICSRKLPHVCLDFHYAATPDLPMRDELIARVQSGKQWLARLFSEMRLRPDQLQRLGFIEVRHEAPRLA